MLSSLLIKNYAIIDELNVQFNKGFSVITGETGAGKSIVLGALSLIIGQRADTSSLKDSAKKCVIEGRFNTAEQVGFKNFFEAHDLDYFQPIILRREIVPSGKSRAFVNDTPVQLTVLKEIGLQLIDIHSQHSNLELSKREFQLNVIDWYANNFDIKEKYFEAYSKLKQSQKEYKKLIEFESKEKADYDYNLFQFEQLEKLGLKAGEQQKLEEAQELLTHSEEIKEGYVNAFQTLDNEEFSLVSKVKDAVTILSNLSNYSADASDLHKRLESVYFELQDVANECDAQADGIEHDPEKLELINQRLDAIFTLQQKHGVASVEELLREQDILDSKLQAVASFDQEKEKLSAKIQKQVETTSVLSQKLNKSRSKVLKELEDLISDYLHQLGMPNAKLKIELNTLDSFTTNGLDEAVFMFAANKGSRLEEINKVASGGEMSRLMLSIKTVVAKSKELPAIVFDEIDTGISGETAKRMAEILKVMSGYMQVINITHLPQIASNADWHYQVYKNDTQTGVESGMRLLDANERIVEIAKMLSGENPNDAAIDNAKSLLK